jgi:pimeloyl-ACP methyl ester carboxylesterase
LIRTLTANNAVLRQVADHIDPDRHDRKATTMNRAVDTQFATGSVISHDSTHIGYRRIGSGPGVALIQGTLGTIDNFTQLAHALSAAFTVYLPERRGRGISPEPFTEAHTVARDVEDVAALLNHAEIHYVFGLSSGGIVALQSAAQLSGIEKIAVYEPPLFPDGVPARTLERFNTAMTDGNLADALVTAMKASQMGPPILNHAPNWMLTPVTNRLLKREAKKADRFWNDAAPTLQFDFKIIDEASRRWRSYRQVEIPVLLLGGSKSPRYLTVAVDSLEEVLPNSQRIEYTDLDHGAAWNHHPRQNRRGNPERVAQDLRRFFLTATN